MDCFTQIGILCQKVLTGQNKCPQSTKNNDTLQNNTSNNFNHISIPFNQTFNFLEAVEAKRSTYKKIFSRLDSRASYPALFSILWYSTLPCYDVKDVTSSFVWEKSLIKHCTWKGKLVPCSAIFTKFPTDQGLCCSFNMKAGVNFINILRLQTKKKQSFLFLNLKE